MCWQCNDSTAAVLIRYCSQCSKPDHGSLACEPRPVFGVVDFIETTHMPTIKYRVLDNRLFIVDPGSPPGVT